MSKIDQFLAQDIRPVKTCRGRRFVERATSVVQKRILVVILMIPALSCTTAIAGSYDPSAYDPKWPNAQYPYARAPNGCGPAITKDPREIRDTWGPVDFTGACNTHDKCYYTLGTNYNTCNNDFYNRLRAACERDAVIHGTRIPNPVTLTACYNIATAYAAVVQAGAMSAYLDVFNEAQSYQKSYMNYVASKMQEDQSTKLDLCNPGSNKTMDVSYVVYVAGSGWRSSGWYPIGSGECKRIDMGQKIDGDIYLYGRSQGTSWGGNTFFCIDATSAFTIDDSDKAACVPPRARVGMLKMSVRSGLNKLSFTPISVGPLPSDVNPIPVIVGPRQPG